MDASTFVGLMIASGVAVAVYQDAVSRGWESSSAVLIAIGVFLFLIIFLPIYLFIKNNPGRGKVAMAANREISQQSSQGIKDITIDAFKIGAEVRISNTLLVRKLLYQSVSKGELPAGIRII